MANPSAGDNLRAMNALFEHIAACVDNSDASLVALDEAWRVKDAVGADRFNIVHVIPSPMVVAGHGAMWLPDPVQLSAGVREWMDKLASGYSGANAVVLEGYPAVEVCHWAEEQGVDLIVAASSRGVFERVLLGSFAGYLARHAPCAVLLTRPHPAVVSEREPASVGLHDATD